MSVIQYGITIAMISETGRHSILFALSNGIVEFSGSTDVTLRIIIIERQLADNWISKVMLKGFVSRYVRVIWNFEMADILLPQNAVRF